MSDAKFFAIKRELGRVRQQKGQYADALVEIAHSHGFFNPDCGKSEDNLSWLDEDLGLDEESNRTILSSELPNAMARQEAAAWACHWLKFQEWELIGSEGTPFPAKLQKLYDKFAASTPATQDLAAEIGRQLLESKHPGMSAKNPPRFPDALVLACWAAE